MFQSRLVRRYCLNKQIIVRKAGFHALRLLPSFKYSHVKSRGRPSMSALIQIPLKHRVFSAGAWSIAGHGVSLMIRVGTSLFMTRQLLPEKFGVMAIASMSEIASPLLACGGFAACDTAVASAARGTV